ncbi:DsbA family oxidoreductase [Sedimentitalea sp. JM2-8]|uniref:DsbA family oxidoreductase n=1 Tax=Sedimentitalea xiamensis TaxID=3050037 RepID=A0ABT7FKZ2_9RHOB|nr:DsbA family oxidoreductase [Sedimentitalea xiamensis]MDK3075733.1 DsbA family oxidoreductase [Sedimentitalea xiamensis]
MQSPADPPSVQIDIVSDVVCPWCIVGYKQVERALAQSGLAAYVRWHPFELNPDMADAGENLREHLAGKYDVTPEQSAMARDRLTSLGARLGFAFRWDDDKRIVNTFGVHQLLDWAAGHGLQHPLKLALFAAYFSEGQNVSDREVLVSVAASVGLDGDAARAVVTTGSHAEEVRRKQAFWTGNGISGVPTMVFGGKYLLTGAQGIDTYAEVLRQCRSDTA